MNNEAIQAFIRTLCPSNADVRLEVASPMENLRCQNYHGKRAPEPEALKVAHLVPRGGCGSNPAPSPSCRVLQPLSPGTIIRAR